MNKKMKKQILLLLVLMMSIVASAQVTIQMEKESGVYKVPCTVNGVKMKFIFDTGAATVSMSQTMAQLLLDGEYLSATDIKGTGKSVLADGSIVNHAIVNLRDVEIGGMHIHNIEATVIEGQNAPLLLGQTAISELGRVSIDGNKLVIHAADNGLTQKQIEQLEEQAKRYISAGSFAAAIESLVRIDEAVGLTEYGLKNLCYCYSQNDQVELCIQTCRRWLNEYEISGDNVNKQMIYEFLADAYFGYNEYDKAILWYQKELDMLENKIPSSYYSTNTNLRNSSITCVYNYLGICYCGLNNYYQSELNFKKSLKLRCDFLKVKSEDVIGGKVKDDDLGLYLFNYAFFYYDQKKDSDGDEIMKMAALCGNQDAIDFCRKYNISYQTKSSKLFE